MTSHRTSNRRTTARTLAAAMVVVGWPVVAAGALNIDLRATMLNGAPLNGANSPKNVTVTQVGDVVSFDVFAVVTGTNASTNDDKFTSVQGSFKSIGSTTGDLLAGIQGPIDLGGDIWMPGFEGLWSSVGLQQDLDGDGDLDVGSGVDSSLNHFWCARFALAPAAIGAGSFVPTTGGRRIGFGTFSVAAIGDQTTTAINFFGRNAVSTMTSTYVQDGVTRQERSFDGVVPIQILAPEPAVLPVIAGTAAGVILLRRRDRFH